MLYEEFEKRYTNKVFSPSWVEITPENKEEVKAISIKKDLATLEYELEALKESIEGVELKKLRLSNLAKMYQ